MWLLILASALAATGLSAVYLTVCIGRFAFVQKLSGGKKGRGALLSFALIALGFAALTACLSLVNAVVILLHVAVFFLLSGLGERIVRRFTGRQPRVSRQGWLALGFSVVYLSAAYVLCHHVWQTDYRLETDKKLGTLKIALIADSHIGTTFGGDGFAEHLRRIEDLDPDLLVIAGDFVDDWSKRDEMLRACRALGETSFPYGVWFAYGNHDRGGFSGRDFTAADLEAALSENGVHILEDQAALVDDRFYLVGRRDGRGGRMQMDALLSGLDTERYIIVLDHIPNDYENEARSAADLVLSGHTHGGQLIPITWVGRLFGLDRTYGHETRQGTDFIVTSGISDWELQFKTGTKSEYAIITINGAA